MHQCKISSKHVDMLVCPLRWPRSLLNESDHVPSCEVKMRKTEMISREGLFHLISFFLCQCCTLRDTVFTVKTVLICSGLCLNCANQGTVMVVEGGFSFSLEDQIVAMAILGITFWWGIVI